MNDWGGPGEGWREVPDEPYKDWTGHVAYHDGTHWRYWVREEQVPPLPAEDKRWASGFARGYHAAAAIFGGPPLPQSAVDAISERVRRETAKAVLDRVRERMSPTGTIALSDIAQAFGADS